MVSRQKMMSSGINSFSERLYARWKTTSNRESPRRCEHEPSRSKNRRGHSECGCNPFREAAVAAQLGDEVQRSG
ncbi:hypothetical protein LJC56_08745 [Christensenellaceae bacterium OttesenSCG-928-K19]|nr:hypothetical protein [Christensenellaceae bacterium OttesenSCG-928-K19]